ncbi:hypothetical protein Lalb_Chr20g0109611 [Lupinus albus]|uniref:Uncharacterized protein n=1 Tax=Lupinus albus TaxID=3870 RepID=A0A6A4NNY4_LUPAL|nr:hypothetical protein Lalb_Chr20g0109611 [Lupinus albus]
MFSLLLLFIYCFFHALISLSMVVLTKASLFLSYLLSCLFLNSSMLLIFFLLLTLLLSCFISHISPFFFSFPPFLHFIYVHGEICGLCLVLGKQQPLYLDHIETSQLI